MWTKKKKATVVHLKEQERLVSGGTWAVLLLESPIQVVETAEGKEQEPVVVVV